MTEHPGTGYGDGKHPRPPRGRRASAGRQRAKLERLTGSKQDRRRAADVLIRRRRESDATQFEITDLGETEVLSVVGEILVESSTVTNAVEAKIAEAGFAIERIECLQGLVARVHRAGATARQLRQLRDSLNAEGAETSLTYVTPNKVVLKSEATPERIGEIPPARADAFNSRLTAERRVPVLILDTGVALCDRTDDWLDGLETPANRDPLDVFPQPNDLLDGSAGHGTSVAGLCQQADAAVELDIRRAIDSDGIVSEVELACDLVRYVQERLETHDRIVVNLSLGAETEDDQTPPLALRAAFAIVRDMESKSGADILVVASAGNDGSTRRCWPAAFAATDKKVVAVGGLDENLQPTNWSTRGPWVTCSTVGEAVLSTFVTGIEDTAFDPEAEEFGENAWAYWTGTSFAAPQVAARIASIAQQKDIPLADALAELLATKGVRDDPDFGRVLDL